MLKRIFLSLLVIFVLGEIAVRVYESQFIDGSVGVLNSFIVNQGDYWNLQANSTIVQPERYGDIAYHINSHGFRDIEHEIAKDNESFRILWLGDSVTFGLSAAGEQVFARQIEQLGNAKDSNGNKSNIESINTGIFGHSPGRALAILEQYGLQYAPDLIVLQTYMNDYHPAKVATSATGMDKKIEAVETSASSDFVSKMTSNLGTTLLALKNLVVNSSAFYRRIRQWIYGVAYMVMHDLRREHFANSLNADELKKHQSLFQQHSDNDQFPSFLGIKKIQETTTENGIPFFMVLTPNEVQLIDKSYDSINQRIRDFAAESDIHLIDVLEPMRELPEAQQRQLFIDGVHLSATGHRFLAELLLPLIQQYR